MESNCIGGLAHYLEIKNQEIALKGEKLEKKLADLNLSPNPIWVHASSHGEGLMAIPLINQILTETDENILLTFFALQDLSISNMKAIELKSYTYP